MSLTEKTLELNVTHELLILGQGLAAVFWSSMPRNSAAIPVPSPPIYAAGLSLRQEQRRGWDVSLELPVSGATPPRVFFLQFKMGKALRRSNRPGSMFAKPHVEKAHVLFGINGNTGMNQHSRLRKTARYHGAPSAALYAFPLVTTEAEVRKNVGSLISRTAFITVAAIDRAAKPPVRDGTARHVAVSSDGSRSEVRSEPAPLDKEVGARLVAEIVAVRLHREMTAWRTAFAAAGRTSEARLLLSRRLLEALAACLSYFFRRGYEEVLQLLRIRVPPPARPARLDPFNPRFTQFLQVIGESDPPDVAAQRAARPDVSSGGDRLTEVARVIAPLVEALRSGLWMEKIPALPGSDLMIEVEGRREAEIVMEEGDHLGRSRLSYLVI